MTWLITGGTGQLGTAVSEELTRRGILFKACGSQELDITQAKKVNNFITKLSPSVIVNCAAWTDVDSAETNVLEASKVNSQGAENIAMAAKNSGAKLLHISTDYVFSGDDKLPWKIIDEMNPTSIYGRTKAEGERRVLKTYEENSTIIRTAWLFSPWGKNFAKTMTLLALRGSGDVKVVNDQIGQPTSAIDLGVKLVELGVSNSPSGTYHCTNSGVATWFEFAQEIFRLIGEDVNRIIPVSSNQYPRQARRPANSVLSDAGWSRTNIPPMRGWRIALADCISAISDAAKQGAN